MKKKLSIALAALVVTSALFAQTVTEALMRVQCDPATGSAQAFFQKTVTIDGQQYQQPWTSVAWSTGSAKSVTVGGQTLTYAQVMSFVVAIANQENTQAAP